jgi:hypothetical protein
MRTPIARRRLPRATLFLEALHEQVDRTWAADGVETLCTSISTQRLSGGANDGCLGQFVEGVVEEWKTAEAENSD